MVFSPNLCFLATISKIRNVVPVGHEKRTFIITDFELAAPNQACIYYALVISFCRRECWIVLKAQSHLYQKKNPVICDSPSLQQFSLGMFLLYPKLRISCLTGKKTDWQWDLGKKQKSIFWKHCTAVCQHAFLHWSFDLWRVSFFPQTSTNLILSSPCKRRVLPY